VGIEHLDTSSTLLLRLVNSRGQMRAGTNQPAVQITVDPTEQDIADLV